MIRAYFITLFWILLMAQAEVRAQPVCVGDEKLDTALHLKEMRASAISVKALLCDGASQDEITTAFIAFLGDNVGWFDPFGGFVGNEDPLTLIKKKMAHGPGFSPSSITIDFENHLVVDGQSFVPIAPERCNDRTGDSSCNPVIQEFKAFYTHAHKTYADGARRAFRETVVAYSGEWKEFIDASRGFTLLESKINGYIYKRNETENFNRPPALQWVVLHPALVIENVGDAVDGQETKEALAIDVFGVNRWRQDKWYLPTGGAITTVYSDRTTIEDWGYGVSLYFGGAYTFGLTWHEGDQGVFISADLLKFLQDPKKIVQQFR